MFLDILDNFSLTKLTLESIWLKSGSNRKVRHTNNWAHFSMHGKRSLTQNVTYISKWIWTLWYIVKILFYPSPPFRYENVLRGAAASWMCRRSSNLERKWVTKLVFFCMHWLDHLQKKPCVRLCGRLVPFLLSVILCPQVCRWFDVRFTMWKLPFCGPQLFGSHRGCNKQICRHVGLHGVLEIQRKQQIWIHKVLKVGFQNTTYIGKAAKEVGKYQVHSLRADRDCVQFGNGAIVSGRISCEFACSWVVSSTGVVEFKRFVSLILAPHFCCRDVFWSTFSDPCRLTPSMKSGITL